MGLVESEYVDSLSSSEIEEKAITEMLASFDPHSVYIPAKYVELASQDLKGGFEGIGIEFFMLRDTATVVRIIPGGPASKTNILPGDRLLSVDTASIIGLESNDVIQHIKGHKNSTMVSKIYRPAVDSVFEVSMERGRINTPSVYVLKYNAQTAFVRIEHFAEKSHTEFVDQLKEVMKGGEIKYLILDLRSNPGGYLQTAIKLLDEMVDGSDLLAYTQSKNGNKKEYHATPGGLCSKMKIACLVNNRSASASEIVSGALQDLDRGTIIGNQTYGKGLVQETFQLNDGAQVRLTVSRYYIPSGRSIQKPYDDTGYRHLDSSELVNVGKEFLTKTGRKVKSLGGVVPDIQMDNLEDVHFISTNIYASDLIDIYGTKWSNQTFQDWSQSDKVKSEIGVYLGDSLQYTQPVKRRLVYQLYGIKSSIDLAMQTDEWVQRAHQELTNPTVLVNP